MKDVYCDGSNQQMYYQIVDNETACKVDAWKWTFSMCDMM